MSTEKRKKEKRKYDKVRKHENGILIEKYDVYVKKWKRKEKIKKKKNS